MWTDKDLAKNWAATEREVNATGYKAVIAKVAEEIWQRPLQQAQAQQAQHLKEIGFVPEVIVAGPEKKTTDEHGLTQMEKGRPHAKDAKDAKD